MSGITFFIVLLLALVISTPSRANAQETGMTVTTSKGTLDIRINYTLDLEEERKATFKVSFLNPGTNILHEHQDYDFRILKNDQMVFSAARQTGQALIHNVGGTITVPYTFQEEGDYTIQVYLEGVGIAPTIPTDEEANIPIPDIPEFPVAVLGGIVAALMTAVIVLARYRRPL